MVITDANDGSSEAGERRSKHGPIMVPGDDRQPLLPLPSFLEDPTLEADSSILDAPAEPGRMREQNLGPYQLVGYLGRGGMAIVYAAQDRDGTPVAVKVLEENPFLLDRMLKRFIREAETAKSLRTHPNIVTVYDTGKEGNTHYIAMELVPGGRSLSHLMGETGGPLPIEEVLRIGVAIASALTYAHAEGIVHRDVKPSNILLNAFGEPLLADFGLARWQDSGDHNLTLTSMAMGTPKYMSPEQIESGKNANELSDQYSFGCVLYELATGHSPYHISGDMGLGEILGTIQNTPPRNPRKLSREISRDLAAVLLKALEKLPRDRYPSMADMLADLRACAEHRRVSVRIPTFFERCDRIIVRHKLTAIVLVVTIVAIMFGVRHYREKLLIEQRRQWVPQARAHSNQSELDRLRGDMESDDATPTEQERHLGVARDALWIKTDANAAEQVLAEMLPDEPFGEDVVMTPQHRRMLHEMARVKLAKGETDLAEKLFLQVAGNENGETTALFHASTESIYARFEASLACLARGDHDAAEAYWTILKDETPGNTPIAAICSAGLGELEIEELLTHAENCSAANSAIVYWAGSMLLEDQQQAENLRQRAKTFAKEGLPWLYCLLVNEDKQDRK